MHNNEGTSQLTSNLQICHESLQPIQNHDSVTSCDVTAAEEMYASFEALRRVASSVAELYSLENEPEDLYLFVCNKCQSQVETRYRCTVCDNFDLCKECKEKDGHPHPMEELYMNLENILNPVKRACRARKYKGPSENPYIAVRLLIELDEKTMVHAVKCNDANCTYTDCNRMKHVLVHVNSCEHKDYPLCHICKQMHALSTYHVTRCRETNCLIPFCAKIKDSRRHTFLENTIEITEIIRRRRTYWLDEMTPDFM